MRTAYWDVSDGVTAPMILGALLDAGLEKGTWETKIRETGITDWKLCHTPVNHPPLKGTSAEIVATGAFDTVSLSSIASDHCSRFPSPVRKQIAATIDDLKQTSACPDGITSLTDAVYILGIHLACAMLGFEPVYRSSFRVGTGVDTPVTHLLQGIRIILDDRPAVLSPIAIAIMKSISTQGDLPPFRLQGTYNGIFIDDNRDITRSLRLHLGDTPAEAAEESILQIETTVDDMNPELIPPLLLGLRDLGALDAWWTSAVIRSGRPGCTIIVLAPAGSFSDIAGALFSETTTIGIRYHAVKRLTLPRSEERIQTALGTVRIKTTILPDGSARRKPAMEDCIRLANESGRPVAAVCAALSRELEAQ